VQEFKNSNLSGKRLPSDPWKGHKEC
jgi:hypothetical protein